VVAISAGVRTEAAAKHAVAATSQRVPGIPRKQKTAAAIAIATVNNNSSTPRENMVQTSEKSELGNLGESIPSTSATEMNR
jgi:hypothetical protein